MCGRASLAKPKTEVESLFNRSIPAPLILPSYNLAPTHLHPIILSTHADSFSIGQWGLWTSGSKTMRPKMLINSRIDSILASDYYLRQACAHRCLIPLDGFYEWKQVGQQKIPHRFVLGPDEIFAVAGIFQHSDQKPNVFPFSILTTEANDQVSVLHDRMPVILPREAWEWWIRSDIRAKDIEALAPSLPLPEMRCYEVDTKLNQSFENDPSLIRPHENPRPPVQLSLFD